MKEGTGTHAWYSELHVILGLIEVLCETIHERERVDCILGCIVLGRTGFIYYVRDLFPLQSDLIEHLGDIEQFVFGSH